jgi:superfamily II DNA or RNA helicase
MRIECLPAKSPLSLSRRLPGDARSEAAKRPFDHVVRIRDTSFQLQATLDTSSLSIQDVFKEIVVDEARNDLIFDDVLRALEAGRSPVVITERTAHLEIIAKRLERFVRHVIILRGGQSEKQRRDSAARLAAIPQAEERVIVATGRYLGEGFDDSRLDTLFLTMPIAWKGTLAQYAGRLHRLNDAKREVIIYDYVDMRVPVLARMAAKRRLGYQSIGYKILGRDLFSGQIVTSSALAARWSSGQIVRRARAELQEAAKPNDSFSACPTAKGADFVSGYHLL